MDDRQIHLPNGNVSTGRAKLLRRKFVLCFDGTGNKFSGTAADSNILKIYSMLDRTDKTQFHYYQPGIGTYTASKSLSHTGLSDRIKSSFNKAKASALGTTLDEHVMAGYRFLMRYYEDGDDIFLFGFSRGAYIARFLAEMLDHVGLLSAGNEELVRFVWKTFSKWRAREGRDKNEKEKLFTFMKGFRETFSRPARRIRFLGLFDTVNSVAKFEGAWMRRSRRFPYTARSTAITIRHAVAIDERRAKFRQDLIGQKRTKPDVAMGSMEEHSQGFRHSRKKRRSKRRSKEPNETARPGRQSLAATDTAFTRERFHSHSRARSVARSTARSRDSSITPSELTNDSEDDERIPQDIEEVWFPGCHADIGGGWPPDEPEPMTLAHNPLVWMVNEARKAGLSFDPEKMERLQCYYDESVSLQASHSTENIPKIEVNGQPGSNKSGDIEEAEQPNRMFLDALESSCTRSKIHDSLEFKQGTPNISVLLWKVMEYLPFRRMDLQPDGSWKAIRTPLPRGETRDIPDDVRIHRSVLRRMEKDPKYRPGNLIVGGGGRGVRHAPESAGMGKWVVVNGKGHPIEEVWVKQKSQEKKLAQGDEPLTAQVQDGEDLTT